MRAGFEVGEGAGLAPAAARGARARRAIAGSRVAVGGRVRTVTWVGAGRGRRVMTPADEPVTVELVTVERSVIVYSFATTRRPFRGLAGASVQPIRAQRRTEAAGL